MDSKFSTAVFYILVLLAIWVGIYNVVLTESEDEIERVGWNGDTTTTTIKPIGGKHWRTVTMEVTAYCPKECCCGKYADGVTASGHVIQPGDKFAAADPSIPFGTMVEVHGYGKVPVLDRGGAIKGDKLDLFFETHEAALQWGRQEVEVVIYGP